MVAAGALLASLAAPLAPAVPRSVLAERPRCYWINPPLTHYQPTLLRRGFLDCTLAACQLTLHPMADAGWVCFFARPW